MAYQLHGTSCLTRAGLVAASVFEFRSNKFFSCSGQQSWSLGRWLFLEFFSSQRPGKHFLHFSFTHLSSFLLSTKVSLRAWFFSWTSVNSHLRFFKTNARLWLCTLDLHLHLYLSVTDFKVISWGQWMSISALKVCPFCFSDKTVCASWVHYKCMNWEKRIQLKENHYTTTTTTITITPITPPPQLLAVLMIDNKFWALTAWCFLNSVWEYWTIKTVLKLTPF